MNRSTPIDIDRDLIRATFKRIDRRKSQRIDLSKRRLSIQYWSGIVNAMDHVELTPHPGDRDNRSATLCRFRFTASPDADSSTYRDAEFRIDHNRDGELFLRTGRTLDPGGQIEMALDASDQIASLVDSLLSHRSAQRAERKRERAAVEVRLQCIQTQAELGLQPGWTISTKDNGDGEAVIHIGNGNQRITLHRSLADFADAAAGATVATERAIELAKTGFAVTIESLPADKPMTDSQNSP